MKKFAKLMCLLSVVWCGAGCEEALDAELDEPNMVAQEIRNGTTVSSRSGIWAAIGRVQVGSSYCTGTLLNANTVLTAAHCFSVHHPNTERTWFQDAGGDWIRGTAFVHPKWYDSAQTPSRLFPFDFAVIKLDRDVDESQFTSITYPQVYDQYAPITNDVLIAGLGESNSGCGNNDDTFRYDWIRFTYFQQDSNYVINSLSEGGCPGDSGGPAFMIIDGKFNIVGVHSNMGPDPEHSRWKPAYTASKWIMEKAADQGIPSDYNSGMSNRPCVAYNSTNPLSTQVGLTAGQNMLAVPSSMDNKATMVWVEKGFRLRGYDSYNFYGGQLANLDGFTGDNCNEEGCWHDLTGTSANNRISSMSCRSDLPTSMVADCVIYNTYGQNQYTATQNVPALGSWSNRAKHAWVKNGKTLKLYPFTNYGTYGYQRLHSVTLTGSNALPGSICNSYGCLHDLANESVSKEGIANSLKCY